MSRYPALIDGEEGAYGVIFPDLPGIAAMGKTIDEALVNAEEALRDYVIEAEKHDEEVVAPTAIENVDTPTGCALVSIPMIRLSGHSVRANLSLDEGVAAFIDGEAARRGMTRTAYVEWMARRADGGVASRSKRTARMVDSPPVIPAHAGMTNPGKSSVIRRRGQTYMSDFAFSRFFEFSSERLGGHLGPPLRVTTD